MMRVTRFIWSSHLLDDNFISLWRRVKAGHAFRCIIFILLHKTKPETCRYKLSSRHCTYFFPSKGRLEYTAIAICGMYDVIGNESDARRQSTSKVEEIQYCDPSSFFVYFFLLYVVWGSIVLKSYRKLLEFFLNILKTLKLYLN